MSNCPKCKSTNLYRNENGSVLWCENCEWERKLVVDENGLDQNGVLV